MRVRLLGPAVFLAAMVGGCPMFPPPPGPTPADEPGPFAIDRYRRDFPSAVGTFSGDVHYPLSDAEAPYPIVAMAPGSCGIKEVYNWVGEHLASHGYVVVAFTPPVFCPSTIDDRVVGLRAAFDFLAQENVRPESLVFGLVDPARRVAIGHSLGAMASLVLASEGEPLDAVIALAPGDLDPGTILASIVAPTQIHGGSLDCVTVPADQRADYDGLGDIPRQLLVVGGGNHVGFTDEFSVGDILGPPLSGDCPRTILGRDHQQRLARRYFTAWLEYHAKGRAAFRDYLDGAQAARDRADGWFTDFAVSVD